MCGIARPDPDFRNVVGLHLNIANNTGNHPWQRNRPHDYDRVALHGREYGEGTSWVSLAWDSPYQSPLGATITNPSFISSHILVENISHLTPTPWVFLCVINRSSISVCKALASNRNARVEPFRAPDSS